MSGVKFLTTRFTSLLTSYTKIKQIYYVHVKNFLQPCYSVVFSLSNRTECRGGSWYVSPRKSLTDFPDKNGNPFDNANGSGPTRASWVRTSWTWSRPLGRIFLYRWYDIDGLPFGLLTSLRRLYPLEDGPSPPVLMFIIQISTSISSFLNKFSIHISWIKVFWVVLDEGLNKYI